MLPNAKDPEKMISDVSDSISDITQNIKTLQDALKGNTSKQAKKWLEELKKISDEMDIIQSKFKVFQIAEPTMKKADAVSQLTQLQSTLDAYSKAVANIAAEMQANNISVPKMATGGIVTRPTYALVGEAGPEAVVPLNRANGVGGMNVTVNVYGSVGVDDIAEKLVDTIRLRTGYAI